MANPVATTLEIAADLHVKRLPVYWFDAAPLTD